jgi:hypothetical protein
MTGTMIEIGRLLRASTTGCVVGCRVSQIDAPTLGSLVKIPLHDPQETRVIGLIHDIHVDDDGLVRQLVTAGAVGEDIIQDNRLNRNVPLEISVLFIGYLQDRQVYHMLPPRPPLTLDAIYACSPQEICLFTGHGHFGYFRHILRASDLPTGELLAAHLQQATGAHQAHTSPDWALRAVQELIILLRDDYPALMSVLSAVSDAGLQIERRQS